MNTVLITGSSRGIGKAAALYFAQFGGWNIVINCHASIEELSKTKKELENFPHVNILSSVGDVSEEAYVHQLFVEIQRKFGGVDILVNNAGIDYVGLVQDMKAADWDHIMAVNSRSVFLCTREAAPYMISKKSGSIVNISSVWGEIGGSCEAAYSASKGAIASFSKAMAKELAPCGIRVNALAFGAINTTMNDNLSDNEKAALAEEIPLGRMGTPEEAAALIYDVGCRYSYMTGQVITLDGGWTV